MRDRGERTIDELKDLIMHVERIVQVLRDRVPVVDVPVLGETSLVVAVTGRFRILRLRILVYRQSSSFTDTPSNNADHDPSSASRFLQETLCPLSRPLVDHPPREFPLFKRLDVWWKVVPVRSVLC